MTKEQGVLIVTTVRLVNGCTELTMKMKASLLNKKHSSRLNLKDFKPLNKMKRKFSAISLIVKPAHLPNGWPNYRKAGTKKSPIKKENSKQNLKLRRESYVESYVKSIHKSPNNY